MDSLSSLCWLKFASESPTEQIDKYVQPGEKKLKIKNKYSVFCKTNIVNKAKAWNGTTNSDRNSQNIIKLELVGIGSWNESVVHGSARK